MSLTELTIFIMNHAIRGYARTFNPCFWTTLSSLRDIPLGRFAPLSHFCTVDTLVFR